MTWEVLFVLALLGFAVISFLREKMPTDQTAFLVFAGIVIGGSLPGTNSLPSIDQLLSVFSNPAPATIAAMFVISAALEKCGVIKTLASALNKLTRLGYRRFLLVLLLCVAAISAFINNTPVVMVFLPVVLSLARTMKIPASKLLMPLSYASIFGGTCTLVGTSTNILASSILERSGHPPLRMFELAALGLPLLGLGIVYLMTIGARRLPTRETLTSLLSDEDRKEFITEAFVQKGSPLVGKAVADTTLLRQRNIRVLDLIRNDTVTENDPKQEALREGDRLVLACRPSGFAHAHSMIGIDLTDFGGEGLETISAHEGSIVEGVIGPKSTLAGARIRDLNFHQRYRVVLMAIHRRGVNLRQDLDSVRLEFGDLLLMMGTDSALDQLRRSDDVLLLDKPRTSADQRSRKAPLVVATVIGVIAAATFDILPIVAAAMIGAAAVLAGGALRTKEAYANIEWSILLLIYGMLALGMAMQSTGTAALIAQGLTSVADLDFIPATVVPYLLLALLYLATMVMTETMSNNATVVLMAPIALSLGAELGVEPRAFIVATCIAASASFSTPIGYQTNTYVYGIGGYRFSDFARVGLPLNLMYFVASVLLIPRIWPF